MKVQCVFFPCFIITCLLIGCTSVKKKAIQKREIAIIPKPAKLVLKEGVFEINSATKILLEKDNEEARFILKCF